MKTIHIHMYILIQHVNKIYFIYLCIFFSYVFENYLPWAMILNRGVCLWIPLHATSALCELQGQLVMTQVDLLAKCC